MNARSQILELSLEGIQIEEAVLALFHTLLFHRTTGKFKYKQEGTYSVGTVGFVDVDCDFVDFTYVRCDSDELDETLKKEVAGFKDLMRSTEGLQCGQICLEFYQKRKSRWPFPPENVPWELWIIKVNVISLSNEHERQTNREKLGEILSDKVLCIAEAIDKADYLPKAPNQSEVESVYDISCNDVQPYLFKISYQSSTPGNASMGTTVRKLLRDTLAL
ncbi:autophagy-related protein 101-like [Antedon mediterranea]|uniref:autophagy-related protein 101-like n=1 Tax=Antedon mediterranea TaxID=105859 RepID=UPI003AF8BC42